MGTIIRYRSYIGLSRLTICALLLATIVGISAGITTPTEAHGSKLTHAQAASRLRAAGITWTSSGNCSDRNNPRCTSFEQINSRTIEGIIRFKRASGCPVNITGGTEVGHAGGTYSHGNGYKVDISRSRCVTTYIVNHYREIPRREGDRARQFQTGNDIYALEPDHWDILYR